MSVFACRDSSTEGRPRTKCLATDNQLSSPFAATPLKPSASVPGVAEQTELSDRITFLSLPFEVRFRIYDYLQPAIEIGTHSQFDANIRKSRNSTAEQLSYIRIMDICQQILTDMRLLSALPRLTVSGRRHGLLHYVGSEFSQWGPKKVFKLVVDDSHFARLSKKRLDFGFSFFDVENCPNLRMIEFNPDNELNHKIACKRYRRQYNDPSTPWWYEIKSHKLILNITLPASPLTQVHDWLATQEDKTIFGLHEEFMSATVWADGTVDPLLQQSLHETDALVEERDLEVMTRYKFGLRGVGRGRDLSWPIVGPLEVFFEEHFEVVCALPKI